MDKPPVEWIFMPLTEGLNSKFAAELPEIATIFNNRDMMRDNINDTSPPISSRFGKSSTRKSIARRREVL